MVNHAEEPCRPRRIIGLMSGTSADGLDIAVVDIQDRPSGPVYRVRAAATTSYPPAMRRAILQMMDQPTGDWETIVRFHHAWASWAADQVISFLQEQKIARRSIGAIASHGQTVAHYPGRKKLFGRDCVGTFQLGDPAVLAEQTGYVTVGDFRWSDIAAGGTGAPLSGYYHHLMLSRLTPHRRSAPLAMLNIGGIANFSVARKTRGKLIVTAFDTGPGNCLSDLIMQKWGKRRLDREGKIAATGKIDGEILQKMERLAYFRRRPPKSCGREEFGSGFLGRFYHRAPRSRQVLADRLATVDELVARAVSRGLRHLGKIGGVVAVGGGRNNRYLMRRLGELLSPVPLVGCESLGLPGDYLEAIGFALLANETLSGRPGNLGGATGARPAILGKICLPSG